VDLGDVGGVGTILIAGPPNGGKSTQCKRLLARYGLLHVSAGDLLRSRQDLMPEVAEHINAGRLVPDDLVCSIVKERLSMSDCQRRGVLLDGFPRTRKQAEVLADLGIQISHVIVLDVRDEVVFERVESRRIDPVSGKIYNMRLDPPKDETILRRLVMRADDTREKMEKRVQMYHENIGKILQFYGESVRRIKADAHPDRVFDGIRNVIEGDLYWGTIIKRLFTVRSYECSSTFDLRGTSDLISATRYFEHMLWLMRGRGVLADLDHPISFADGAKLNMRSDDVDLVIRAHSVELKHALVAGLDVQCRIWLEKVGVRSLTLGFTISTSSDEVEKALALLMMTGQQKHYLELLRDALAQSYGPWKEIEIARGSAALVAVDARTKKSVPIPQRKRLQNLVHSDSLSFASTEQPSFTDFSSARIRIEKCPGDAHSVDYLVQPRDIGMDGVIEPATLVSLIELARYTASRKEHGKGPRVYTSSVSGRKEVNLRPRCLWVENIHPVLLGNEVTMRTWTLKKPPTISDRKLKHDSVFIGFEMFLKDNESKQVLALRGCEALNEFFGSRSNL